VKQPSDCCQQFRLIPTRPQNSDSLPRALTASAVVSMPEALTRTRDSIPFLWCLFFIVFCMQSRTNRLISHAHANFTNAHAAMHILSFSAISFTCSHAHPPATFFLSSHLPLPFSLIAFRPGPGAGREGRAPWAQENQGAHVCVTACLAKFPNVHSRKRYRGPVHEPMWMWRGAIWVCACEAGD
jgi:hypothetical protein